MADGPKSTMSMPEIFDFLAIPISLTFLLIQLVSLSAIGILILILNHGRVDNSLQIMLAICVPISLILLRYVYVFFYKMIHRMQDTGNLLLSGDELQAFRLRWNNPPIKKKVAIAALFFFIAFCVTYGSLKSSDYQASFWIIPVLMWLIAIIVAIDIFLIKESKWPLAIVGISYCLTAISSTYFKMSNLHHQDSDWFFPALMWLITIICINGVFRSTLQKRKIPRPEVVQMPPEAS